MRTERLLLEVELVRNIAHHLLEQAGGLLPRRELHPTSTATTGDTPTATAAPAASFAASYGDEHLLEAIASKTTLPQLTLEPTVTLNLTLNPNVS